MDDRARPGRRAAASASGADARAIGTYVAVAAASLILSLLFLRAPGSDDVAEEFLPWMASLHDLGLGAGYESWEDMYPPGVAILLNLADRLLPRAENFYVLSSLVGAAQLAAALLFAVHARSLVLSLAFLAATALSSSALMYLDVLYAVPLLVAFYASLDRRPTLAASAFAVACLIKWQPLILLPFLAILWLDQAWARGPRHVVALILVPTLIAGGVAAFFWPASAEALFLALEGDTWSGQALNLAWLAQILYGKPPIALFFYMPHQEPWLLALKALFAAVYLPILVTAFLRYRRDPMAMLTAAFAGFVAYFLLSASVHENHLYVPTILGFVLWSRQPSFAPYAIAVATFSNLNLVLFYGLDGKPPFAPTPLFGLVTAALSLAALLASTLGLYHAFRCHPVFRLTQPVRTAAQHVNRTPLFTNSAKLKP
ncbi:hypothetical protein [Reyranella sp.]|uniref:hypothetical protein n=1 Tax=Reyranella sp. TaxID=1929291 RepID=UPI003BAA6D80